MLGGKLVSRVCVRGKQLGCLPQHLLIGGKKADSGPELVTNLRQSCSHWTKRPGGVTSQSFRLKYVESIFHYY